MSTVPTSRRVRRGLWAGAVAVVLTIGTAAGAYALFSSQASTAGGVILNGDLQLQPDSSTGSAVSWIETTSAVPPADRASGTDAVSLAGFRGVPGDTVEVRYAIRTTLAGDNISAVLRAGLGAAPPAGVTVTGYRVLTATGTLVAPAVGTTPMGSTTVVPSLTVPGDDQLLIAVQLSWTGTTASLEYTAEVSTPGLPTLTTLPVTISLEQVRQGAGWVP